MKVAIDARRLQDVPLHGVGRGLANLIPHLAKQVEVVLLFDRRRRVPRVEGCESVTLAGFGSLPEIAWAQISVPSWLRRSRVDVYHGPYNTIPYAMRLPGVVTIHDLAWEHHPEYYSSRLRSAALSKQARWSARHAGAVLTVSEFTRAAIIRAYGVDAASVLVAPNAVDPIFNPSQAVHAPSVLSPLGVRGPYVVALGGATRRGLPIAVEAWERATEGSRRHPVLVTVGAEVPPPRHGVIHAGALADDAWAAVLAGAIAFCYPTRYEGFGMPALEAISCGTPVVSAPVASLPEVLGDATEWAASPTAEDMAAALKRLLENRDRRDALRTAGIERATTSLGWAECSNVILSAYQIAAK